MSEIKQTERASKVLQNALECCREYRHEFVMPEHLLIALLNEDNFHAALNIFYSPQVLEEKVRGKLQEMETVPEEVEYEPEISIQMSKVLEFALQSVSMSSAEAIDTTHLTRGLLRLQESWAAYLLKDCLYGKEANFISQMLNFCDFDDNLEEMKEVEGKGSWKRLVLCMNDHYKERNPLIGREAEIKRTIQVLCRKDKNNPLHVGESGVGKTALVWGLVRRIEEGKVPERLKGSRIYQIDMGSLIAGTQYRGDFENRIKDIMDGILQESDKNIVYIDEIHTLVGAGATTQSSLDASNMMKPYLENGNIRFIGSTTYEEYNKYFQRSKGMIRRFQQIDILEPTIEETKNIIRLLQPRYEEFHGVTYDREAIDYAVEASAKYVHDRFLPDKAIDLIDEAGAAKQMSEENTPVDKALISEVLAKTCKVDALSMKEDEDNNIKLSKLSESIHAKIYGQDEAIRQVVEAVLMAKAGLVDDNKPMASLLFVGPTGVGKTEIAKVLAQELGIELVRFDMSEYTEKHTVAKLIGSPAGYIGYEDGGLLTDAIRRSPNCVLLLDEIEKAHKDIYNILLQVMDYARLTDNKGNHADFRNVILIMTSNAGAMAPVSFGYTINFSRTERMIRQVKNTFSPEFLNRLTDTVAFNELSKDMATLILKKKLGLLEDKLRAKKVTMKLRPKAFEYLLEKGFTPENGAREIDHVITQELKPLLMREIIFGDKKEGGTIKVGVKDGSLSIG